MLFEGEITEDLLILVYGFAIFIIIYVVFAVVLFFGYRKGKQYEQKKRQLVLQEEYLSSETRKTQESFSNDDQKEPSQYPT
jgi:hypothetical protein